MAQSLIVAPTGIEPARLSTWFSNDDNNKTKRTHRIAHQLVNEAITHLVIFNQI
jgi:hypothetical protein